jgi:hypothetical protein
MKVRLTQLDGNLPNLALMKLAHWHRSWGDEVTFTRDPRRDMFEPDYDHVYGSAIFRFSEERISRFKASWPNAIIGGTGTDSRVTVEDIIGAEDGLDYSDYRDKDGKPFEPSIGFTQRGCRMSCKFCVVPAKEGKAHSVATIDQIWRGPGHAKKLLLLDNDFFGQPEDQWRARIDEIRTGDFRVSLNQGINVRQITPQTAEALASIKYRNGEFTESRLYTAWDNLKDEEVFFRGVDILEAAGIPPKHLMAYMLVGFDKNETWDRIWRRFDRMVERGIKPFPMVFDCRTTDPQRHHRLKQFQRWVCTGLYRIHPWKDYDASAKTSRKLQTGQESLYGI